MSLRASSDFSATTDNVCPRRSCRSRPMRSRSAILASRAISSLIQTQGVGDLNRIYLTTKRDGFDFNLAYIPKSFTRQLKEPFETAYMDALFQVGYDMAAKGFPWVKAPPGFDAPPGEPIEPPLQN